MDKYCGHSLFTELLSYQINLVVTQECTTSITSWTVYTGRLSLCPSQSYTTALEYFQKAAEKGSSEGQYYMGYMHLSKYCIHIHIRFILSV